MNRKVAYMMALLVFASSENSNVQAATIDRMTTNSFTLGETYTPGDHFEIAGDNDIYYVSDGTTWDSGAGSYSRSTFLQNSIQTQGSTLTFDMRNLRANNVLINYTDFDAGSHSSQAELRTFGPMQIVATVGSNQGTLSGWALVYSNVITNYGLPRFQYFTSPVGTIVPFTANYLLLDTTWDSNIFSRTFHYKTTGEFFFDAFQPAPEPSTLVLSVSILGVFGARRHRK
jgi:hypothetical protein